MQAVKGGHSPRSHWWEKLFRNWVTDVERHTPLVQANPHHRGEGIYTAENYESSRIVVLCFYRVCHCTTSVFLLVHRRAFNQCTRACNDYGVEFLTILPCDSQSNSQQIYRSIWVWIAVPVFNMNSGHAHRQKTELVVVTFKIPSQEEIKSALESVKKSKKYNTLDCLILKDFTIFLKRVGECCKSTRDKSVKKLLGIKDDEIDDITIEGRLPELQNHFFKISTTKTVLRKEVRYEHIYAIDANCIGVFGFQQKGVKTHFTIPNDMSNMFLGKLGKQNCIPNDKKIQPGTYKLNYFVTDFTIFYTITKKGIDERDFIFCFLSKLFKKRPKDFGIWFEVGEGLRGKVDKLKFVKNPDPVLRPTKSVGNYLKNVETRCRRGVRADTHPPLLDTKEESDISKSLFFTSDIKRFNTLEMNDVGRVVTKRISCKSKSKVLSECVVMTERLADTSNFFMLRMGGMISFTRLLLFADEEIVGFCVVEMV